MYKEMYGRRMITTDETEIHSGNIMKVLENAKNIHFLNQNEIEYLWNYYKGKQPVIYREKTVRPEVCNRIVENRANEIVSFKVGYLCGEPIQYVGRKGDEAISKAISELNEMMFSENKATQDKEIVEWQMICGTAFRLVLPDDPMDEDEAPFEIFTLNPKDTFVVYSNEIGNKPLLGVKITTSEEGTHRFSVYSKNEFWKIQEGKVLEHKPHALGVVPIIEYPANNARLGSFETVLPLLDMLNDLASNRMDGVEQFVQSFVKFVNCDITEEDFTALKELGAIKVKSDPGIKADVDIIASELNQSQVQVLVDYVYQSILTICGMPNRNGGLSTSDTGSAVIMRDGWTAAETRAKDSELMFKQAEQKVLKLILRILRDTDGLSPEVYQLKLKDIALQFTRRNYENIQSKAQVLTQMLQQPRVHPRLAFQHCGLFTDSEDAYRVSEEYYQQQIEISETQGSEKGGEDQNDVKKKQ